MTQLTNQSKADFARIIRPWGRSSQRRLTFINANVVEPLTQSIIENACVELADGDILAVNSTTSTHQVADSAISDVVDLGGRYLCPGLIDCHVHIAVPPGEASLQAYEKMSERVSLLRQPMVLKSMLDRGFTSIRDCGGASFAMKQAVEDGIHPGPRLFIAGRALSQTGGHGDMRHVHDSHECCAGAMSGISRIVDGVPQCLKYAREELRQGADFIKIMGGGGIASPTDQVSHLQFSEDEIRAITTVAKNAGTYVTSHSYTPAAVQQAIRCGVRAIEHGNLIDQETAKLMAETGTFLTPTLIVHATSKEFNFLPPESAPKNEEVLVKGIDALKLATDAGVTVCFGTDLLGPMHFAQSKEFSIRAQVQSPGQVLQSATTNAAKLVMQENRLGQIKAGYAADMLVLERNPLEDITVLDRWQENVLAVIKGGRVTSSRTTIKGLGVE